MSTRLSSLSRRHLILAAVLPLLAAASQAVIVPAQRAIVILISIDGFRADYLERFHPPRLRQLARDGVMSDGLIPQFPSKTFPNHYTIVTGLTPAHHGIISNNMRDPEIPGKFTLDSKAVQADPRWWGGEPIWNTVERQGRKAASMFWPGSEVKIGGRQASYWVPFDNDLPHADRVGHILDWLKLPEGQRPAFLTLYFSDVDSAGHSRGPDSAEVRDAVMRVDASIGTLVDGIAQLGLADRVHYVVVSDHGMAATPPDRMIVLDDYLEVSSVDVVDWAPVLALSPRDGNVDRVYNALHGRHPALAVYRSRELPAEYRMAGHPRLPAVIGIAQEGWFVTSVSEQQRWREPNRHPPGGTHGYDVRLPSMHGLFIATGPRLRSGVRVKPFENIHVYEFMCAVLGVTPAKNDGDPAVTRDMLR